MKTPGSKRAKAVESAEDARIRQVFEQFDTNRGGSLDRKELRNALEALGMEGTRENVRTAMKRYDDDRSRTLDLGEFTQMVRDPREQQPRPPLSSPCALALPTSHTRIRPAT